MNFYRAVLFLLTLFSCKTGAAQTEHHVGMVAGKVIVPIYTMQHHRWDVTATGGWLTGLRGGHVSVNGTYKLLDGVGTEAMRVYAGLGLFGQGFTAASGSKQEQFAKRMNYDTPFGVQIATKMHVKLSEKWSYEMHIGMPLFFYRKRI